MTKKLLTLAQLFDKHKDTIALVKKGLEETITTSFGAKVSFLAEPCWDGDHINLFITKVRISNKNLEKLVGLVSDYAFEEDYLLENDPGQFGIENFLKTASKEDKNIAEFRNKWGTLKKSYLKMGKDVEKHLSEDDQHLFYGAVTKR